MQKIIVVELDDDNESTFVSSAESALGDAQRWGTINRWRWADSVPVEMPGQEQVVNAIKEDVSNLLGNLGSSLQNLADELRIGA